MLDLVNEWSWDVYIDGFKKKFDITFMKEKKKKIYIYIYI